MANSHNDLMNELVAAIKPTVSGIESGVAVTQNHYGAYMGLLAVAPSPGHQRTLAVALLLAGANRRGVADACKALGLV